MGIEGARLQQLIESQKRVTERATRLGRELEEQRRLEEEEQTALSNQIEGLPQSELPAEDAFQAGE